MFKSDLQGTLALTEEFRNNFDSIWLNLRQKIVPASPIDGPQIFLFYSSFEQMA